jgi:hypothetical protein
LKGRDADDEKIDGDGGGGWRLDDDSGVFDRKILIPSNGD